MNQFTQLDRKFVWHPFTQMRDWLKREPIVIASGKGAVLRDVRGREYLDANSSIWTNLHGHNHPKINAAIRRQLKDRPQLRTGLCERTGFSSGGNTGENRHSAIRQSPTPIVQGVFLR